MAKVTCYGFDGEGRGTVELPARWFDAEVNKSVVYQAARAERTNRRAGTASTKTRAQVRGGGAKPWRQKGTGRARAGSIRSPLWPGGGVVHGPKSKHWNEKVPQQVRRQAFASALTDRARDGAVRVVELEAFDKPGTRRLVGALGRWEASEARTLLLTARFDDFLFRSGRNVPWLTVMKFADASALDVLDHDVIVVEKDAWDTRAGGEA